MQLRSIDDAQGVKHVEISELQQVRTTLDHICCFDGTRVLRIRWHDPSNARVHKTGLSGYCHILWASDNMQLPGSHIKIHFCKCFPSCAGVFNGIQCEVPSFHVVALSTVASATPNSDLPTMGHMTAVSNGPTDVPELLSAVAELVPTTTTSINKLADAWKRSFRFVGLFAWLVWGNV